MKLHIVFILCCLLLLFSACSSVSKESDKPQSTPNTTIAQQQETEKKEYESVPESRKYDARDAFINNSRIQYKALYNAYKVFEDSYMPEKAWLIGPEYIVELLTVNDLNYVSVISRESIYRIEQSSFGDFVYITVYDKIGQSITITANSDDLISIIESIR